LFLEIQPVGDGVYGQPQRRLCGSPVARIPWIRWPGTNCRAEDHRSRATLGAWWSRSARGGATQSGAPIRGLAL